MNQCNSYEIMKGSHCHASANDAITMASITDGDMQIPRSRIFFVAQSYATDSNECIHAAFAQWLCLRTAFFFAGFFPPVLF